MSFTSGVILLTCSGAFADRSAEGNGCHRGNPQYHVPLAVAAQNDGSGAIGWHWAGLYLGRDGYVLDLADDFAALTADVIHPTVPPKVRG